MTKPKGHLWHGPLYDKLGTMLEVGAIVYYNLSGDIAIGTIIEIAPGRIHEEDLRAYTNGEKKHFSWALKPMIKIEAAQPWGGSKDKPSKMPIWYPPHVPVGKILVAHP